METNQYLDVFIDESKEHLQGINDSLLQLEKDPTDLTHIEVIFRAAHTIKGMSATMGYDDLANLTHQMENVLDQIRNKVLHVTQQVLDVLFTSVDLMEAMVDDISSGGNGKKDVSAAVAELTDIELGKTSTKGQSVRKAENASANIQDSYSELALDSFTQTVIDQSFEQGFDAYHIIVYLSPHCLLKAARAFMVFELMEKKGDIVYSAPNVENIEKEDFDDHFQLVLITKDSKAEIEAVILKVSEIAGVDLAPMQRTMDASEEEDVKGAESVVEMPPEDVHKQVVSSKEASVDTPKAASKTIRVNIAKLDHLMNLFEELVVGRGRLEQISKELGNDDLNDSVERMVRTSQDLQSMILTMRMVPVDQVFNRFPRMVRQLAKDLGKQVQLDIVGAETELDRTVIDEIGDPLVHLIRNALDHGIETPEVRVQRGKTPVGHLTLSAYHSGNHVFIDIKEDGAGIAKEKVLAKAIERGLVTSDQADQLEEQQVFELTMAPGFSTAEKISDVSGRGVGLDVVKNTIESLGGHISITSELNKGTTFSVQLPLTLSIISVMLTKIADETYAIPLSSIVETAIIRRDQVMRAHQQEVIDFRGKVVPLVFLGRVFNVEGMDEQGSHLSVLIVRKGDKMAGIVVDELIGQQEVVLKSLGNYLTSIFAISGATILGDGKVSLIVDCNSLIKS
ncbi:chemotaxis protein CheA [Aureibacillus halotolerans]|uniref:Chemotaxis protein CheA n=1 Tax=Aureibacillus halotolerans TaxID=1508390 RepID=A0A4R6U061_9BACI|nr:chemotaxis protein CheA [Aureibacillus halotolerans]TDQ39668.1 two-component system chemotaxis sensor kinase CheA [Aureibacillus halotolerans]